MFARALVIVGVCSFSGTVSAGVLLGPIVNPNNNHTYYLLTQNDWPTSQAEALALGGNLVTINDAVENDWVYDTFGGEYRNLWIGYHDPNETDEFVWVGGDSTGYTNWYPGQPDDFAGIQDAAYILSESAGIFGIFDGGGKWDDVNRGQTFAGTVAVPLHGVVEIVPEPAACVLIVALALVARSYNRMSLTAG